MQSQETFNPYNYRQVTQGIEIIVRPFFAKELSDKSNHKYVFIYKIAIKNHSPSSIQLISRKWHIIEKDGTTNSTIGEGVVGQQPIIEVNSEFEYASQAVLYTESGIMYGSYFFTNLSNSESIEAIIPAFSLDI